MFALSIYDTLTPGSLTDGQVVAGTGTITADGKVGQIGGIQQKIAGARQDGAQLFLVPPANCADALGGDNGSMRLVKAPTLAKARSPRSRPGPPTTTPRCRRAPPDSKGSVARDRLPSPAEPGLAAAVLEIERHAAAPAGTSPRGCSRW